MKNGMPTFNPSDHKQVDWFTEYDDTGTQINDYIPPELDGIWEGKTPIIITQKQPPYTALIIHKIASKTDPAKYNELISWACNVEALEKPNRFLVIHPASKKAEETIRATINSIPQLPPNRIIQPFGIPYLKDKAPKMLMSNKFMMTLKYVS